MKNLFSSSFFRLVSLVTPYRNLFMLGLVALALGSSVNLLFPEITRRVLNSGSIETPLTHPRLLALGLVALFALQGVCFYFRTYLFGLVGQRVVTDLRRTLFGKIAALDVSHLEHYRPGDLVSRLMGDTALMQDAVSVKLSVLIRYSLQVAVGLALMSYMSPRLTLTIVFALVVLVGLSMVLGKRLRMYSKALQSRVGEATDLAEDLFGGARIIRAFNAGQFVSALFERANGAVHAAGLQRISLSAFFQSFVNFLMNGALVMILLYGIFLASNNVMTFGDLMSFLLYGAIVAVSFGFAVSSYSELLQAVGGAERVFEFIDRPEVEQAHAMLPQFPIEGSIEFRNVSYRYVGRHEHLVLDGVSFKVPKGKVTAIVGASGSGKSTLLHLLMKFYAPNEGQILLDGVDIATLLTRAVREAIAVVPQDAQLFGLTIADNLRLAKPDASIEEMECACRSAAIIDFIRQLPNGFETMLGAAGTTLSGGQRQRLAIARAALRNPAILVLDESTSALDSENEERVQAALQEVMQGRTTIIVAHRLSSIKNAEHIIVLEGGMVMQQGTFQDLVTRPGLFQDFVRIQERKGAA